MNIPVSGNAVAGRRLFLQNRHTLLDFSDPTTAARAEIADGLDALSVCELQPGPVSRGTHALRLHAAAQTDGTACHRMSFVCRFAAPADLRRSPTLTFAFSAYDGETTDEYFREIKENMHFVERPDPQLVSRSFLTVTLLGAGSASRTVQLVDYGFNRIFANFSGEAVLAGVEAIRFEYRIDEAVPEWQRVIKLDTVEAGMEVDFTLKGNGMECLFAAENAALCHRDGVLTATCAADAVITLPDLTGAADTLCDIFLPVKNTLLLRMEADCPELSLTVAFRTEDQTDFAPENRKTFAVSGLDRPRTLFLNLSDIPGTQGDLHAPRRLTGLRLMPDRPCTLRLYKLSFEQE